MLISDYYYILVYSGTFFLFGSITQYSYKNYKSAIYIFILFLTSILNWNMNTRNRRIKIIDKYYVSFLILNIIKNIIYKLRTFSILEFYDILTIGFILQILFFYTLSKICTKIKSPRKAIFHSIMHLNGFCMILFLKSDYMKIMN